jgi:hypothetical protein
MNFWGLLNDAHPMNCGLGSNGLVFKQCLYRQLSRKKGSCGRRMVIEDVVE